MLTVDAVLAEVVQSGLRDHLADPTARLSHLEIEPMSDHGFSGSQLHRARLCWTGARAGAGAATWVVKRWLPGGPSERLLGVDRPIEVLGWEAGLLRPEALPSGVCTPIVGAWRDPAGPAAWIVMEDVSEALSRYSRATPLPPSEALARVRLILDGLARLHSRWEQPEQQARLRACSWLVPMERMLWCEAASCATVLGRVPPSGVAPGSEVTDDYRANVTAFLAWIPARDRRRLENLLCQRQSLVAALAASPRTLLHGDLDDRNLGLRPADAGALRDARTHATTELVLIDWEWMGFGTPALDIAHIWGPFPAICDPAQPCPEAVFSGELLDFYFERYQAHGGRQIDPRSWRRSCELAMLALAMSQVSFIGAVLRHDIKPIVATMERQLDTLLETARSLPVR